MGKRVLIVDDAAFMRMMIKDILTKNGYEVAGERKTEHGQLTSTKSLIGLVIMDITMPEMDGIAAVREIKKINADSKIIMCSAMGQQAMVIESIQAGARDLL